MNISLIAICRTQHITIYEGLCELIRTCTELPADVFLVCPHIDEKHYKELISYGVKVYPVSQKGNSAKIPTSLKLLTVAFRLYYSHKASFFIGCDGLGNIIAAIASKMTSKPYVHYSLELPHKRDQLASFRQKLEHWSYRQANLIITMDQPHADFIVSETGVSSECIVTAPVTLQGPSHYRPSISLRRKLELNSDAILILHAGGIGAAQASIPLAEVARCWPSHWHLVFHAHCDMSNEEYYRNFVKLIDTVPRVHLNAQSVSPDRLDDLISNADIGLGWYDRELLGYRADLLGLAAGKIGRYLRNGIPVVVKNLPTIRSYVERYSCGICVDEVDEIGPAIATILSDHNIYSKNALRCYEEVWRPDRHLYNIRKRLFDMLTSSH
jgi:glycosyltransferase involved in cell wall biosynthesis